MTELEELRAFIASKAFENMDPLLRKNLLEKEINLIFDDIKTYCNSVISKSTQDFTMYIKHVQGEETTVRIRSKRNDLSREEKNKENNLPKNYGKKWTPEDDNYLKVEYDNNKKSIAEVAAKLERKESSVFSRLMHLGILRVEDNYNYKALCNMINQLGEPYNGYKADPNRLVMLLTILALVFSKNYKEPVINYDDFLKIMFWKCWAKNIPMDSKFQQNPDKAFTMIKSEPFVKDSTDTSITFDRRYFTLMQYRTYYSGLKALILDLISKC